jgi:transcriptional regulator with PAS, ATPase and Fis domain
MSKESEQRLSDSINFLPDTTSVIDINGSMIAWNKAMEDMDSEKNAAALKKLIVSIHCLFM